MTHLRPWLSESFAGLQPGYVTYSRNLMFDTPHYAFWVHRVVMILEKRWARKWRFIPLRPFVRWGIKHLINVVSDLVVECVKTDQDDPRSTAHGGDFHPSMVQTNIGVLEHHYYGRSGDGLSVHKVMLFGEYKVDSVAGFG